MFTIRWLVFCTVDLSIESPALKSIQRRVLLNILIDKILIIKLYIGSFLFKSSPHTNKSRNCLVKLLLLLDKSFDLLRLYLIHIVNFNITFLSYHSIDLRLRIQRYSFNIKYRDAPMIKPLRTN